MFYMNANLPSKSLIQKINNEAKTIFVEVNTQSSNGCLWVATNHSVNTKKLLVINKIFVTKYGNLISMVGFNSSN